ncbi:molybdate ABC transporter substrate-binding protein [Saccharicrinis aurantiacus]|uniref:molybdate ABC transporter substrate-binding protein n=1 Tax=Saccharicrinis aurantiacus TaxID=1849719 RepID=UPI0024919831|nr:molybdate ABC transporter substrate-binding protein [Saccharicrinis aurantiacus]
MRDIKIIIVVIAIVLCSCVNNSKKDAQNRLVVFAGAGLTDALTEICDSFFITNGVEVKLNLASSGTLARQIEQGGEPDLYISASKRWADYIDSLGYVVDQQKTMVAGNKLSLIQPINSKTSVDIDSAIIWSDILADDYFSIGDPSHVPAGKYAVAALKHYGWYTAIKPKMLPAKDVRSALMVVELGEVPYGIVYKTDALKSSKVKIVADFADGSHPAIQNIASVISDKSNAQLLYKYLQSPLAKSIWMKYGFSVPE